MITSAVALTQELVRYQTMNPPGNELACIRYIAGLLESAGFAVTCHLFDDVRANLVARLGGSDSKAALCFTGHIDTVPLGGRPWTHDPFAGEIADGKLYGRGSTDMKSGVASFCIAAAALADKLDGTPGVEIVITSGEETGCSGAAHLISVHGALGRVGAILVAEPSSNRPCIGHKGALWLKGIASGVSAHGSMPSKGVNAVYKAARAIGKLEDFDFNVRRHPLIGAPTVSIGTVQGGTVVNAVPDHAEFTIDIRTIPEQDHGAVRAHLASYLGDEIELETIADLIGIWTDPDVEWVREVFDVVTELSGERPGIDTASYFSDASVLSPAYGNPPSIVLGPGEAALAHQTDEYCFVDRIDEAVDIFGAIARRWCGL